jgi:hypothetical protein
VGKTEEKKTLPFIFLKQGTVTGWIMTQVASTYLMKYAMGSATEKEEWLQEILR